jgi:hypothetical protein
MTCFVNNGSTRAATALLKRINGILDFGKIGVNLTHHRISKLAA